MIRAPKLAPSRPMYAFNPDTFDEGDGFPTVDAVWFKRKSGVLVAVMGSYHPMVLDYAARPSGAGYAAWVAAADDNRYGGDHVASWNGTALIHTGAGGVQPDVAARHLEFLTGMLAGFPDPPPSFDGWWTFPRRDA